MLGKSPIKWRQRPDMNIAVDWDVKHQFKQTHKHCINNLASQTGCLQGTRMVGMSKYSKTKTRNKKSFFCTKKVKDERFSGTTDCTLLLYELMVRIVTMFQYHLNLSRPKNVAFIVYCFN